MKYPYKFNKRVAENWTRSAKDCYSIGCNCEKCLLYKVLETECKMKYTVMELVKKCGAPTETLHRGYYR